MAIRDALLAEFDHEMISTRQTLERVPEGKPDWAPHEKSMKMGRLAGHLAELSGWAATIINQDELDFRPAGAPPMQPLVMTSRQQLLDTFDKKAAEARAALSSATASDGISSAAAAPLPETSAMTRSITSSETG